MHAPPRLIAIASTSTVVDEDQVACTGQTPALGTTEFRLLELLRSKLPKGSNEIALTREEMGDALGRSVRTITSTLQKLKDAGLITRHCGAATPTFPPKVTVITPAGLALNLTANSSSQPAPRSARRVYPFAYLYDRDRLEDVPASLDEALKDCKEFQEHLKQQLSDAGALPVLEMCVQRRRKSDGERGGLLNHLQKLVNVSEALAMSKHVGYWATRHMEVTFRVQDPQHALLLIDDLNAQAVAALPFRAIVVETSPGSFQASLVAPRKLSREERLLVQKALVAEFGGDPAAVSSSQLRRPPGSINNKASLGRAFVARLIRTPTRPSMTSEQLERLLQLGRQISPGRATAVVEHPQMQSVPRGEGSSESCRQRDNSPSGQEFRFAMRCLSQGMQPERVVKNVAAQAARRGKAALGSKRLLYYAYRTVEKAGLQLLAATRTVKRQPLGATL